MGIHGNFHGTFQWPPLSSGPFAPWAHARACGRWAPRLRCNRGSSGYLHHESRADMKGNHVTLCMIAICLFVIFKELMKITIIYSLESGLSTCKWAFAMLAQVYGTIRGLSSLQLAGNLHCFIWITLTVAVRASGRSKNH